VTPSIDGSTDRTSAITFRHDRIGDAIWIETIAAATDLGRELRAAVTEEWAVREAELLIERAVRELLAKPGRSATWWSTSSFRRIRWTDVGGVFVGEESDGSRLRPTIQRAAAEFGAQRWICGTYGADLDPIDEEALVALAPAVMKTKRGVEGTRYLPSGRNSGWILIDEDFRGDVGDLKHEHAFHVVEAKPQLARYFGLPPGWRFFAAADGENVREVGLPDE